MVSGCLERLTTDNGPLTTDQYQTVQTEHAQLIRGLGLIAAISVNVANIIGTGVFLKARVITCNVGSPGKALAIWVFAGLLSIAGALTYAELLAMMPRAAGEYGIIRDAYGRAMGFVYGWTQFFLARTASAAALAMGFAIFLNDLIRGGLRTPFLEVPLPWGSVLTFEYLQLVAVGAIIITTPSPATCHRSTRAVDCVPGSSLRRP